MIDKIAKWLHSAAGRKAVTYVGLLIGSIAAACTQLGDKWLHEHGLGWLSHACGSVIFLGLVIAAFGRGLADRRVDPEIQGVVDKERREPNIDG